jgi:hypothetical protein
VHGLGAFLSTKLSATRFGSGPAWVLAQSMMPFLSLLDRCVNCDQLPLRAHQPVPKPFFETEWPWNTSSTQFQSFWPELVCAGLVALTARSTYPF